MKPGSKYAPLFNYLQRTPEDKITLSFAEIEALLEAPLPPTARAQRGWWSNRSSGSPQAASWMAAGYHTEDINLEEERVTFRRPPHIYTVRRKGDIIVWDSDLVKALRIHAGWNQAQLAAELGVRQQTVSEWETGVYQPSRHMCKFITLIAERAGFTYAIKE